MQTEVIKPFLTIGMAHAFDYNGAYFTLQAIRAALIKTCPEILKYIEFLIVDNFPENPDSKELARKCEQLNFGTAGCRYVSAPEIAGTSAPRNRVFAEARGVWVLCIDCHIGFLAGTIEKLFAKLKALGDCKDLFSGPNLWDSFDGFVGTHWNDMWRSEMWGTWGQAWEAPCSDGDHFSIIEGEGGMCKYISLEMGMPTLTSSAKCGVTYPQIPFAAHEKVLESQGYVRLGYRDEDDFEIPGCGLGVFCCRKDAWLGFNPMFMEFGGEEMYIHEKFRQHGHKCRCLGLLQWYHRYHTPVLCGGTRFPLTRYGKVRNYVLGAIELGRSVDPIKDHFVAPNGKLRVDEWEYLMEEPRRPRPKDIPQKIVVPADMETLYEIVRNRPRDFNEHFPILKELASKCDTVVEISKRCESTVALAAGKPKRLISFNLETDADFSQQLKVLAPFVEQLILKSSQIETIPDCDLLLIDSEHSYAKLTEELTKYGDKVNHYIVLRGTKGNGTKGEDGGKGLIPAIKEFMASHEDWLISHNFENQYGLTVLSKDPADRPAEMIILWTIGFGPGTQLHALLAVMGITPAPGCDCNGYAETMDRWGLAKCKLKRDEIKGWLVAGLPRWGWMDKIKAAAKLGITHPGLALFQVDLLDPMGWLVDASIKLEEQRVAKETKNVD